MRSDVCPRCLGTMNGRYIEEGDTIIATDRLVCLDCGFSFVGVLDEDLLETSYV
jgi:hypothetical protein